MALEHAMKASLLLCSLAALATCATALMCGTKEWDMAYNKINETLRYDKQLRLNVEGKSLPWAGMAMNFTITVRQCRTADPSCANSRSLKAQALANTLKPYADMTLSKNWMKIQVVYSGQEVVPDGNVPTDSDAAVAQLATALASNPFFVRTEAQEGNQWVVVKPRALQLEDYQLTVSCGNATTHDLFFRDTVLASELISEVFMLETYTQPGFVRATNLPCPPGPRGCSRAS